MTVRELECEDCAVTLRGNFGQVAANGGAAFAYTTGTSSRYDALNAEQAVFLETFLRCRGVIRDVEAALGISYPTVRGRLDALLATLGLSGPAASESGAPPVDETPKPSARDILSSLDSGQIDAHAALDALRKARGE